MQWKDSWLQPCIRGRRAVQRETYCPCARAANAPGVANTRAHVWIEWWIPKLRSKVKKVINQYNTCKVFSTKPYRSTTTAEMLSIRIEDGRSFETTGLDFAGPLEYKITKKERGKCYVLLFTCATLSGAPGGDKIADSLRVSKKTEVIHCQKDKTSPCHFRQRLGIQGYPKLDKEDTEEQEAARPEKPSHSNSTFPDPHGGEECMSDWSRM